MALVCGNVADAEDAVQDAFVALWQALDRGESVISPKAWLTTASLNRLRTGWRRKLRHTKYLEELNFETSRRPAEPDLADAIAVRANLAKLPMRQRQAAVLYYLFDLSVEEAGMAMGSSPGMVKNALFRARQTLADSLDEPKEGRR
jgi:RNA polymerase sigma-70 factor (ECF subfamily)